ncbi:MAG: CBS domain-containing protein [Rhodomicrobium sp.]
MHHFLEWHVSQYMTKNVTAIPPGMTLQELAALFEHHDYNCFPVVEGEVCVGIVTKFDFLKAFVFTTKQLVPHYQELMALMVGSIMTKDVSYVEPEEPLTRALDLMIAMRARSIPVLEPGHKLVGMISRTDLTRALFASIGS